jgi:hypothetical protein
MKTKFFIVLCIALSSLSIKAQTPYKHSIGGILGFFNGVSYKTFVDNNFAIQADLGMHVSHYMLGLNVNGNFMYEQAIQNGFYWFAGGGITLGPAFGYVRNYPANNQTLFGFRLGLNGIGGAEYKFNNIPLTLQADIRPGISFYMSNGGFFAFFDYNFLNASVRYTF